MKDKFLNKKSAFSLMEVALAVLIVAILAMLTIPIINRQLEKSEEYSYYLAYRTVEKLGGQIVALGDAHEVALYKTTPFDKFKLGLIANIDRKKRELRKFARKMSIKYAKNENSLFAKLFPKAYAYTREFTRLEWESIAYDSEVWLPYAVCFHPEKDYPKQYKYVRVGIGTKKVVDTNWTADDFSGCAGIKFNGVRIITKTHIDSEGTSHPYKAAVGCNTSTPKGVSCDPSDGTCCPVDKHSRIKELLFDNEYYPVDDDDDTLEYVKNVIISQHDPDARALCNEEGANVYAQSFIASTSGKVEHEHDFIGADEEEDDTIASYSTPGTPFICKLKTTVDYGSSSGVYSSVTVDPPKYDENWCSSKGYINMKNVAATSSIDCQCSDGYVLTENSEKACYKACPSGQKLYDTTNASGKHEGLCLPSDEDYNPVTKKSCGPHAVYVGGGACECVSGWSKDEASGECTVKGPCPKGTTDKGGVCVTNPPIIKAKRFCELIVENWNTASHKCDTFTSGDASVYQKVFNAALGNDSAKTFMSINSKQGAFNSITPNVVLSNGLKLWILGDKAASITGLSFYPAKDKVIKPVNMQQNMCIKRAGKHTKAACSGAHDYFCGADNNCFTLHSSSFVSSGERGTYLYDARGCCSASDMTDFHKTSAETGADYRKEPTVYAIGGFTVFVDIDGDKGSGTLWEDVFPFYVSSNGKVYPGYPLDTEEKAASTSNNAYIAGNSEKQLPVDVYYYENVDGSDAVKRILAFPNVSFARGMCSARKISKYTPYCLNIGKKYSGKGEDGKPLVENYIQHDASTGGNNPCDFHACHVTVKNKLRFF